MNCEQELSNLKQLYAMTKDELEMLRRQGQATKVYAIICSGKYTDSINGELFTADRIEIITAFTSQEKATERLNSNPDVAEPAKWGVRAISIYDFDVQATPKEG